MSQSVTLNDRLKLTFPEGFQVMDKAKREKLHFLEEGPGQALSDPDRHIIVTVSWKKSAFSALLLSAADAARSMESKIRKPMQAYGYRSGGFASRTVGGEKAEGFSYAYDAGGAGMVGESLVLKHGKVFYYLHIYAREALKDESMEVWNGILSSAVWTKSEP